jgi:hypothetical protein
MDVPTPLGPEKRRPVVTSKGQGQNVDGLHLERLRFVATVAFLVFLDVLSCGILSNLSCFQST